MSVVLSILAMAGFDPAMRFPSYKSMSPDTKEAIAPYWNCVVSNSARLEPSHEAADIIVKAAFESCHDERLELEARMGVDLLMAGDRTPSQEDILLQKFDQEIESVAVLKVVEIRLLKAR